MLPDSNLLRFIGPLTRDYEFRVQERAHVSFLARLPNDSEVRVCIM